MEKRSKIHKVNQHKLKNLNQKQVIYQPTWLSLCRRLLNLSTAPATLSLPADMMSVKRDFKIGLTFSSPSSSVICNTELTFSATTSSTTSGTVSTALSSWIKSQQIANLLKVNNSQKNIYLINLFTLSSYSLHNIKSRWPEVIKILTLIIKGIKLPLYELLKRHLICMFTKLKWLLFDFFFIW